MPRYNYICDDCEAEAARIKGAPLAGDEYFEVIFETSHKMVPTPEELAEARVCPRCSSSKTTKTVMGCTPVWYVRGNGYLDKRGCHRAMNLHHLLRDDPYAEMREVGEADDLAIRIRRGGEYDPHTQYFPSSAPPGASPSAPPSASGEAPDASQDTTSNTASDDVKIDKK